MVVLNDSLVLLSEIPVRMLHLFCCSIELRVDNFLTYQGTKVG